MLLELIDRCTVVACALATLHSVWHGVQTNSLAYLCSCNCTSSYMPCCIELTLAVRPVQLNTVYGSSANAHSGAARKIGKSWLIQESHAHTRNADVKTRAPVPHPRHADSAKPTRSLPSVASKIV